MRISGTEPSSVILSQTIKFKKLKSDDPKVPKQAKAKRDGVINPQNYNFNQFNTENKIRIRWNVGMNDRDMWSLNHDAVKREL